MRKIAWGTNGILYIIQKKQKKNRKQQNKFYKNEIWTL